ncbi:hypothetical protein VTO42DRAFT_3564 [Malbranchea cinnamomea]
MNDTTTALLTEHFSYTPLSLIDDIINSVNNLIYQAISSLETGLLNTPPERLGFKHAPDTIPDTDEDGNIQYPEARLEIENGLHQLETLLEANVDKAFDKFEIYVLRNIFKVPEDLVGWVRLSHYKDLSFGPRPPNAPTIESITRQREKLRETRKLNRLLRQEAAQNDAVIAQLKAMLTPPNANSSSSHDTGNETVATTQLPDLSFLLTDPTAKRLNVGSDDVPPSHTPLTTNTTFILSQLPALRALVEQLRPKLATLPKAGGNSELNAKRAERKEYIDSRTRLHLQRMGDLSGTAGDGPGVVPGRRVASEEVKELENVARMFDQ